MYKQFKFLKRLSDEQLDEAILKLDQDNNKMINQSELFDFLRAILKQSVPEYTSDNEGMNNSII